MDRRESCLRWMSAVALVLTVGWLGASALAADADQAYQQAILALQHKDFDRALAEFDEAIRIDPNQARFRGLRGTVWIRKGDIAKGIADLNAAIRMNAGDAGAGYQAASAIRLSDKAKQQGRQQVEKMLRDRPAMSQYGVDADFLRQWAARRFAGEGVGQPIDWDPTPPLHSDAEHLAPSDDEPARFSWNDFTPRDQNKAASDRLKNSGRERSSSCTISASPKNTCD